MYRTVRLVCWFVLGNKDRLRRGVSIMRREVLLAVPPRVRLSAEGSLGSRP